MKDQKHLAPMRCELGLDFRVKEIDLLENLVTIPLDLDPLIGEKFNQRPGKNSDGVPGDPGRNPEMRILGELDSLGAVDHAHTRTGRAKLLEPGLLERESRVANLQIEIGPGDVLHVLDVRFMGGLAGPRGNQDPDVDLIAGQPLHEIGVGGDGDQHRRGTFPFGDRTAPHEQTQTGQHPSVPSRVPSLTTSHPSMHSRR